MCIETARGLSKIIFKGRRERIAYLRSFKKGRFAVIYLTTIPLYCIGHMYAGQNLAKAFFSGISKIIELVVLKYDFSSIEALMDKDAFYCITVYFGFVLAALNVGLVTVSFANQRLWEISREMKTVNCPKDRIFIFGSNPRSVDIYKSDKERNKVIIDKISEEERESYYLNEISYLAEISDDDAVKEIFNRRPVAVLRRKLYERVKKNGKAPENIVIINTENDERNMRICRSIIEIIDAQSAEEKERIFSTVRVFVFGDLKYEAIYEDIESDGCGCITFINKYKKVGSDFIERYPLALFMDEKQIDYETSLVRKDVNINFFMICFGKVGRQIFLTSVANNQFLTEGENGPELKKVRYHIFDKEVACNNKNLNHNYYRYRNEYRNENKKYKEGDYLPLPSLPAEEHFHHLDINDGKLYEMLRKCVREKDANFVLISFGNDLENIDMAQKLVAKRREWGQNLVIFVRAHKRTKEQAALEKEGCLFIGDESEIVYNIDKILSDKIQKIAIMRNEDYDLEYAISQKKSENFVPTKEFIEEKKRESFRAWHGTMHRIMRESNIYAALSIRAKLNLMGFDYCEVNANNKPAVTEEQYFAVYAKDDMPEYSGQKAVCGRKIIDYGIDFKKSRRWNMAVLEHYRWNSYLISKGFVPADKETIITETETDKNGKTKFTNGRNYLTRRHGNLTTFDGLVEYRKLVAERDNTSEKDKDVIKYDYQILDDLYYFLTAGGYKIIEKE